MDINKEVSASINNVLAFKGVNIEITDNYTEKLFNLEEEQKKDNIRLSVKFENYDERLFLDVLKNMIANGEIDIKLTQKATERHLEYLGKLTQKINS